jgi:hypothetical protein
MRLLYLMLWSSSDSRCYFLQQRDNYEELDIQQLAQSTRLTFRAMELSPKILQLFIHWRSKKSLADASPHRFQREKYRNEAFQLLY